MERIFLKASIFPQKDKDSSSAVTPLQCYKQNNGGYICLEKTYIFIYI